MLDVNFPSGIGNNQVYIHPICLDSQERQWTGCIQLFQEMRCLTPNAMTTLTSRAGVSSSEPQYRILRMSYLIAEEEQPGCVPIFSPKKGGGHTWNMMTQSVRYGGDRPRWQQGWQEGIQRHSCWVQGYCSKESSW